MCENAYSYMNISDLVVPDYFKYLTLSVWENVYSHMNISDIVVPDYFKYLFSTKYVWECILTHEHF